MTLEKSQAEELLRLVSSLYPDWSGFDDPRFHESEIGYKQAAVELFAETLSEAIFADLIEQGDWEEIKKRLIAIGGKTNLLFRGVPKSGDLSVLYGDGVDLSLLCPQIFELVYGDGETSERLEAYSLFTEQNELPNKWTFPTYLLFFAHPESEFFIKPSVAKWFLKFSGSTTKLGSKPVGAIYEEMKSLVGKLRASLPEEHEARDMIDLQSLIWVAKMQDIEDSKGVTSTVDSVGVAPASAAANVWKIAPGRGARWWDVWDEHGIAAVGWSNTGDLSSIKSNEDFKELRRASKGGGEDEIAGGARQAWRFAHQVKVGDVIVANKGKSEILGIGTVTGEYRFVPEDEYPHQRDVEWHDVIRQQVDWQEGWLKTLVKLPDDFLDRELSLPNNNPVFTSKGFELLAELSQNPFKTTYEAKKEDYENYVKKPLKELLQAVIQKLPDEISESMKTDTGLFSRIGKNDFGQGGAWDFYWGAIYDPGSKRTQSVQLFCMVNKDGLKIGFSLGSQAAKSYKEQFTKNVNEHMTELTELLADPLSMEGLLFEIDGDYSKKWQDWIVNSEAKEWQDVEYKLTVDDACRFSRTELVELTLEVFESLFPLVILAVNDDPVPQIMDFLEVDLEDEDVHPAYELEKVSERTGFELEELQYWVDAIHRKKQAVFYGPPGTGKTFVAQELSKHMLGGGNGIAELVQFHPAYEYEDFMTGIRPRTTEAGGLSYDQVPGRFLQFCQEAKKKSGLCVLIIDEINRANLSRVFGELMYLLEYRESEIPLAGGVKLRIPDNVRLIGTMNTADRSIALVDHALRRRFAFLELRPNYDALASYHETSKYDVQPLISVLQDLNRQIDDKNYEVGISFFIDDDLELNLPSIWQLEIEPYLEEFFLGQANKVEPFRWNKVLERLGE